MSARVNTSTSKLLYACQQQASCAREVPPRKATKNITSTCNEIDDGHLDPKEEAARAHVSAKRSRLNLTLKRKSLNPLLQTHKDFQEMKTGYLKQIAWPHVQEGYN